MIEVLPDLPDGALGFRFTGPISREEYVDILLPPMKAALEKGGVRLLFVIDDDFGWFQPGAFWEDLKFGLGPALSHHKAWARIAIVSDLDWIRHAMGLFAWMMPGEARTLPKSELDQAKQWVAA
ncbi:STAS/SEC14 domain-containing protein [Actinoplanes sp. NPDC049668]|uniref:STAS/SEC14 domain-containing protein n=1 Tax=unclassified Actinoplanes TaxID=2626549 RepID=UPI0033A9EAFF